MSDDYYNTLDPEDTTKPVMRHKLCGGIFRIIHNRVTCDKCGHVLVKR